MLERLTPAAYRKWELYWIEEPWGPWRDNLHAAIIAREVRRPWMKRGQSIDMDDFMIRRRENDAPTRINDFLRSLFAMSTPAQKVKRRDKSKAKARKRKLAKARRRK